jgi:exopolyphosphatase/guanosine-5'-triphosphate,3'-diphosphate pyrophosphatase
MGEIVPRWEWRTFGSRFGTAETQLAARASTGAASDEIYLLAREDANVKVRGGQLDIKMLRQVDRQGLEQWLPVLRATFPLAPEQAARALETLALAVPRLAGPCTLDEFLSRVGARGSAVRVVRVRKRRTQCTIGRCLAELADVSADGRATRTLAVESEDPDEVSRLVRELGLGGYVNTNYPRGLAALVAGEAMRFSVIDVGTNSVKFHAGERAADGAWHTVADRAELTRLGEGLAERGTIAAGACERTAAAIARMVDEARQCGVRAIVAVGTAALRRASNRVPVIAAIEERSGVRVEVLPGEEEGRLAFLAASSGLRIVPGPLVVFDSGGGSTQFTFGRGSAVEERFSVDVGAVRYTERFGLDGAVPATVLHHAMAAIATDLARLDGRPAPVVLIGMGGAATNMAAVRHGLERYDADVVQGTVLDVAEVDRQIELYRSTDAAARAAIRGLQPQRAGIILAGACIIRTIMTKLRAAAVTVSDRGLRHGVLIERFGLLQRAP